MTTRDEHLSATTAVAAGPETSPAGDPVDDAPAEVGVLCQAESVEIGAGTDPFDATFLMSGIDPQGGEVAVWIRLTPTTINDLIEQLDDVLLAQQQALGPTARHGPADHDVDSATADPGDPDAGEGRVKRFFDPMGIRHLKDRSPRATAILGAAIASLMVLAFVLQLLRR